MYTTSMTAPAADDPDHCNDGTLSARRGWLVEG